MNFAPVANIAMMFLCAAVLLQSVRLMRALKLVRDGGFARVIETLDQSTQQARSVLSELKQTLGSCAATSTIIAEGKEMAEELSVMIGIANSSADRLLEAASEANRSSDATECADAEPDLALAA